MTNKKELKKLGVKPVIEGYKRKWIKCIDCGDVASYDYLPYSIGNPIRWLPCGHNIGKRFYESYTTISETEAIKLLKKQIKAKD